MCDYPVSAYAMISRLFMHVQFPGCVAGWVDSHIFRAIIRFMLIHIIIQTAIRFLFVHVDDASWFNMFRNERQYWGLLLLLDSKNALFLHYDRFLMSASRNIHFVQSYYRRCLIFLALGFHASSILKLHRFSIPHRQFFRLPSFFSCYICASVQNKIYLSEQRNARRLLSLASIPESLHERYGTSATIHRQLRRCCLCQDLHGERCISIAKTAMRVQEFCAVEVYVFVYRVCQC